MKDNNLSFSLFKPGDLVRVKDDLIVSNHYGKEIFSGPMSRYLGKVFRVQYCKQVFVNNKFSHWVYSLYGVTSCRFAWTYEMLEKI